MFAMGIQHAMVWRATHFGPLVLEKIARHCKVIYRILRQRVVRDSHLSESLHSDRTLIASPGGPRDKRSGRNCQF